MDFQNIFGYGFIISSIKDKINTGYIIIDLTIMIILSIIIKNITSCELSLNKIKDKIISLLEKIGIKKKMRVMEIEVIHKPMREKYGTLVHSVHNRKLYKAIMFYIKDCDMKKCDILDKEKNGASMFDNIDTELMRIPLETIYKNSIKFEFKETCEKIKDENEEKNTLVSKKIILKTTKTKEEIEKNIEEIKIKYKKEVLDKELPEHIYSVKTGYNVYLRSEELNIKCSFDNWFHNKRNKIIDTINRFRYKKKYNKKNRFEKLGILLHGKPGCGKTSFIKSIATYLQRSIISFNLDHIHNLNELRSLFYSSTIESTSSCIAKPIQKRIIVFEEIDTMGKLVENRQENNNENEKNEKKYKFKNEEEIKEYIKKNNKNINIGDLLTCLSGVNEMRDVVYIFTTNHKEKLDPALYREGRIDIDIELDYINGDALKDMIEYYLPNINTEQKNELYKKYNNKATPAKVENELKKFTLKEEDQEDENNEEIEIKRKKD